MKEYLKPIIEDEDIELDDVIATSDLTQSDENDPDDWELQDN